MARTYPKTGCARLPTAGQAGPKSREKAVDKARETAISEGDMALQRNDVQSLRSRLKPENSFGIGSKEYLEKLSAFIEKAASDYPENIKLECKHFFSGAALYAEERICITLTPVGLAVKLPKGTRDKLLKNKKAIPLCYFPKGPIKEGYVLFPNGGAKGGKALHNYVKESIAYVLTIPKPKRKR